MTADPRALAARMRYLGGEREASPTLDPRGAGGTQPATARAPERTTPQTTGLSSSFTRAASLVRAAGDTGQAGDPVDQARRHVSRARWLPRHARMTCEGGQSSEKPSCKEQRKNTFLHPALLGKDSAKQRPKRQSAERCQTIETRHPA
jgi:hypothetical protein